jgi:C4-type Zn-finger protein
MKRTDVSHFNCPSAGKTTKMMEDFDNVKVGVDKYNANEIVIIIPYVCLNCGYTTTIKV